MNIRWIAAAAIVAGVGCGGGGGHGASADGADADAALAVCGETPLIWHVVDAWGRPIGGATLSGDAGPMGVANPVARPPGGAMVLHANAPDYAPAVFTVDVGDGSAAVTSTETRLYAAGRGVAKGCPVDEVFLGLDHLWFPSQAMAFTGGNAATFYATATDTWVALGEAIGGARRSLAYCTWWWQSDFELDRTLGDDATPEARRADTILARLEALGDGVKRQILVNRLLADSLPGAAFLTTDAALRAHGMAADDNFEVLLQGNHAEISVTEPFVAEPRPIRFLERVRTAWPDVELGPGTAESAEATTFEAASWHMKAIVIDGQTAFLQGMNTMVEYWDTLDHRVFDARRMNFEATPEARAAVTARHVLPDHPPHLDYGIRLDGPIVADVSAALAQRWALARQEDEFFGDQSTEMERAPAPPSAGDLVAQIQMTEPPPDSETSILDGQLQAIAQANDLILIVDQYWRAERLQQALVDALMNRPNLHVVVVTNEIEPSNGGKKWTYQLDQALRGAGGDRYLLLTMHAFDVQTPAEAGEVAGGLGVVVDPAFFIHAKLMLIDDRYLSVGSANKNNRSLLYDGEMNVAILGTAWVRAARRAVVEGLVGQGDPLDPASGADVLSALRDVAEANAGVVTAWEAAIATATTQQIGQRAFGWPRGFVYPYEPDGDYLLETGPDFY